MSKAPFDNEDIFNVTRGLFGGSHLNYANLDEAMAHAFAFDYERHKGRYWLKISVPAGLFGFAIGALSGVAGAAFVINHAKNHFAIGFTTGLFAGIAAALVIPRLPGWFRHCWKAARKRPH